MELRGKTALVTGGAKRVGKAIAWELATQGVHILLHYHRSEDEARQTLREITSLGVSCHLFKADLSRTAEIRDLVASVYGKTKTVDILVNSASLFFPTPVEIVNEKDWDRLMDANLKGPFSLSIEIARRMTQGAGGKIINIADWSAFRPYKNYLPYCTSKGGLVTMTKALARDFAPKVFSNAVAPGPVMTPPDMSEAEQKAVASTTALGRWGKPEDVAHAVRFLLESDFINGTVLVVDGGRSIV